MSSGKISGLSAILKKLLTISQEIKEISLSTDEGVKLISESRSKLASDENNSTISSLVPSFVSSSDQCSRLGLGAADHSILWLASGNLILQKSIHGLILSILLDESANIGLIEEQLESIQTMLSPFCSSFTS